jgi:hypothetical protein
MVTFLNSSFPRREGGVLGNRAQVRPSRIGDSAALLGTDLIVGIEDQGAYGQLVQGVQQRLLCM